MDAVKRPVVLLLWTLLLVAGAARGGPQALQEQQQQEPVLQELQERPDLQVQEPQEQLPREDSPQDNGWGAAQWEADALAQATARLAEQLARQGLGASSPFTLLLDPEAALWGGSSSGDGAALGQAAARAARAAWDSPSLRGLRDALPNCAADAHLLTCARRSLLALLDRVGRSSELRMLGGAVTLTADPGAPAAAAPTPAEEQARSGDGEGKEDLDERIVQKVAALAASRTLTLRMPAGALDAAKRSIEEFRGKKGKGLLPALLVMGLMMKGMLFALAMGTVALIAGKALTVGLMALVISAVIGLKKLASGGGGGGYEVVNVQAPHHYARTLAEEPPNHLHPYRAHAPAAADTRR